MSKRSWLSATFGWVTTGLLAVALLVKAIEDGNILLSVTSALTFACAVALVFLWAQERPS